MRESFYHYQFSHSLALLVFIVVGNRPVPRIETSLSIVCSHNLPSRLATQSNLFTGMYMKANAI